MELGRVEGVEGMLFWMNEMMMEYVGMGMELRVPSGTGMVGELEGRLWRSLRNLVRVEDFRPSKR